MTTRQAFWFNVRFFAGMWRPELWRNYPKSTTIVDTHTRGVGK
jgi:hypothetical protein